MVRTRQTTRRASSALLLALLFALSACAMQYMPVSGNGVLVEDDTAVRVTDDMRLSASMRLWLREPTSLPEYYTTVLISVRNTSDEVITIKPQDVSLLDDMGRQYDAVPTQQVAELLLDRDPQTHFAGDLTLTAQQRDDLMRSQTDARANLQEKSFPFGDLLPGATKGGFVFFHRLPAPNRACTFVFRGEQVRFEMQKH